MPIPDLSRAILRRDLPVHELTAGDVGVIVGIYGSGAAYEVEFLSTDGDTIAVETLVDSDVEPLAGRRILHPRVIPLT